MARSDDNPRLEKSPTQIQKANEQHEKRLYEDYLIEDDIICSTYWATSIL